MEKQIKSKKRVADHGEVFTRQKEIKAMLDLVKNETVRIDSRFLEPACGSGNFLLEILKRKLFIVAKNFSRSQKEYEFQSIVAISSLYGIELLADNVETCKNRLLTDFIETYHHLFPKNINQEYISVAKFILDKNIILGDALKMAFVETDTPIIFSQWSPIDRPRKWSLKRHDYEYQHLISESGSPYKSIQQYYSCYFMDIQNAQPIY